MYNANDCVLLICQVKKIFCQLNSRLNFFREAFCFYRSRINGVEPLLKWCVFMPYRPCLPCGWPI